MRVCLVTERVRGGRRETAYEQGGTGLITGRIMELRTLLIAENRSFSVSVRLVLCDSEVSTVIMLYMLCCCGTTACEWS